MPLLGERCRSNRFTLFDADDELVTFAGRVMPPKPTFVQQTAQAVLRDFGPRFSAPTLGFHLARWPVLRFDVEPFSCQNTNNGPNFARRFAIDNQPALVAVTLKGVRLQRISKLLHWQVVVRPECGVC